MKVDVKDLVHRYAIKGGKGYTAEDVLNIIIAILSYQTNDRDSIKEHFLMNELATLDKPISEIKIYRGGIEFKFKHSAAILEMFKDWIDESRSGLTKTEMDEEVEEGFRHFIESVRPFFNTLTHLRPRKRHLLIHELLQLAGYPFTRQQLNAGDQAKASLIAKWFERSKPKTSSQTATAA